MEYLYLIGLWSTWCAVHSGMISITATRFLKRVLGDLFRFYRLFYNFFATVTLIPLVFYERKLTGPVLFRWDGSLVIVQIFLMAMVIFLFLRGVQKYDIPQLLGIRQIRSGNTHTTLSENAGLDPSGILQITRHPWYLAAILFVWVSFREMTLSMLVVRVILTAYLIIGTLLEERKLVAVLGNRYKDYQKRVSMLFPFKWFWNKTFRKRSVRNG